ncbi:MAG TPA: TauD/TfdA family dioxygenase [Ilumatobacter sp.]
MRRIASLDIAPASLDVTWDDGVTSRYPWLWIRDHAHDEATLHPVTRQRQLHTAGVRPDLRGTAGRVVDGRDVEVTWHDGTPASRLPIEFLHAFREPGRAVIDVPAERVLWDADTIAARWPTVAYDDVMADDDGVARWLELVAVYGFGIAVGTPPTLAATEALIRRVGYVRETIFGGFWHFQADLSKADTAYTTLELLPHTDGTYSHDAPGLQLLHCLGFEGEGGESTMVDGFRIAAELRAAEPELYRVLSTVEVPGQYVGDGAHLMAARPVFRHDRSGALVQVSFNNADRAPFLLPPTEMDAFYEALRAFESLANDASLQWRRLNPPGNAMLFDNWRVLHGRAAYTGHRHLCGAYLNHEDFESRRRLLRVSGRS